MKLKVILVLLLLLLPVAYAQEVSVISHVTDVVQTDIDHPHLDTTKFTWFLNNGTDTYKETMRFYVPEEAEDVEVYAYVAGDQYDLRSYLKLAFNRDIDEISLVPFSEIYLHPKTPRLFLLRYSMDLEEGTLWKERIIHDYIPESMKIWYKPLRDYEPRSTSIALFESTQDPGWYESEMLSPQKGDVYSFSVRQKVSEGKHAELLNKTEENKATGSLIAVSSTTILAVLGGVAVLVLLGGGYYVIRSRRNPWVY